MSTPSGVWAAGMGAPAGSKHAHHGTTMLQSEEAVLVDFRGQLCLGQWNPENLGPSCSLLGFSKNVGPLMPSREGYRAVFGGVAAVMHS